MGFTTSFSQIAGTSDQRVRSSVQLEVRITSPTNPGQPIVIGRLQNLNISEDYAQQLVKEIGSPTGVEFVAGIASGTGSASALLLKGRTWKNIAHDATGQAIDSIKLHHLPDCTIVITDREDGQPLFTLRGVAFQNAKRSIQQGNNMIAQDVSFGFIDMIEGEATP